MTLAGKLSRFFTQLFMLLTIPILVAGVPYILCFGLGLLMIYLVMTQIYEHKGSSIYPFFEPSYGGVELKERKVTKEHDIKDKYGVKIGSYETEETEEYYSGSMFSYSRNAPIWKFGLYILCYPFLRIVSFVASFIALFTDKFYVQITTPDDYNVHPEKYSRFLLCYFDIVCERDEKAIERYYAREKRRIEKESKEPKIDKKELFEAIGLCFFPPLTVINFIYCIIVLLTTLDKPKERKEILLLLKVSICMIIFWIVVAFSIIIPIELRASGIRFNYSDCITHYNF